MNTQSHITDDRIRLAVQARFNPIRGLEPDTLSRQVDQFKLGHLRQLAITFDAIEERDLIVKANSGKRKKDVARNGWEILTLEDSSEAKLHQEALQHFYNNLTVTSALDQDELGGTSLLLRQMMDAVGKKYAVHEIVWQPSGKPGELSAEMRFCPLWFFEAMRGRLQFLPQEFSFYGIPMEPSEWLVTVGDGLMLATSIAYMFKQLSMRDWMLFNKKYGIPPVVVKTDAEPGSEAWKSLEDAVADFGGGFSAVMNRSADLIPLELASRSMNPFNPLIEYCDRGISALWRGGDLGTMSRQNHQGASLQGGESDVLVEDDALRLSETLNIKLDRWVIYYLFGVAPKAYFKVLVPQKKNVDQDIKVDAFLLSTGAKLSEQDTFERYNRAVPRDGEQVLSAPTIQVPSDPGQSGTGLANERQTTHSTELLRHAVLEMQRARSAAFTPLIDRVKGILDLSHPEAFRRAMLTLKRDLPAMTQPILADPRTKEVYSNTLAAAFQNGRAEAVVSKP